MSTRKSTSGFTLVEIAIVLLIITALLAGLVPTLSSQVDQRHVTETVKQLDEIQQALIGFAVINGRLPCPADGTIATGLANAGVQKATCAAGANGGVLPWVTLGVAETDAWGRRFTYRVTPDFASSVSFTLATTPNLNVGLTTTITDNNVAAGVPAVVISHGKNGTGAYLPDGLLNATAATGDEVDNAATDNNNHFVSHDSVLNGFDDIVTWISPNILFNRMVSAGKLP